MNKFKAKKVKNLILKMKNLLKITIFILILSLKYSACKCNEIPNNKLILVDAQDEGKENSIVTEVNENFDVSGEAFEPTNEWQTVKEKQAIPAGLHVRLNLETGQREAKLLERTVERVEKKRCQS